MPCVDLGDPEDEKGASKDEGIGSQGEVVWAWAEGFEAEGGVEPIGWR